MKAILSLFASLFFTTAQAVEVKEITLNVKAEVAVAEVDAACVSYVNSEGESDGTGLFFSTKSLKEVEILKAKGFTSSQLLGKEVCSSKEENTTLPQVFMNTYASAKKTHEAILKAGGYKLVKVAFYDEVSLEKKIAQERQNAFNAL